MYGVNKFLFTNMLCPRWFTKYIHISGNLPMEMSIQRFLRKALLEIPNDNEKFRFFNYFREDYICDTEYKSWLFNVEQYTPRPSIEFVTGVVTLILTCQNHSGGTEKNYIHPPRKSNHVLPYEKGDQ